MLRIVCAAFPSARPSLQSAESQWQKPGVAQDGTSLPDWTERDRLHAARCRWLLTVLYLGGLRAAEVASTRMCAFFLPA